MSEAVERQHLSLTIPWAVDYMSMMDIHALKVPNYLSLLSQMITVYRYMYTYRPLSLLSCGTILWCFRSVQVEGERITTDEFMVLTSLGWLLEVLLLLVGYWWDKSCWETFKSENLLLYSL